MNSLVISSIIAKKTGIYLKASLIFFLSSLILLSSILIFYSQQFYQIKKDFLENINTHLIEITHLKDSDNQYTVYNLSFDDEKYIRNLLSYEISNSKLEVYNQYFINFGISDNNSNTYFIFALDDKYFNKVGIYDINNIGLYFSENSEQNLILKIPIIENTENGYVSYNAKEYEIKAIPFSNNIKPLDNLNRDDEILFLSIETFKDIIEIMYQISWEDFINNYNSINYGINLINKIYVYVNDLDLVKNIANKIQNNNYEVSYTLSAFENIKTSINNTLYIFIIMIIFITLISMINTITSFRRYIFSMSKDIGILLHYGYNRKMVFRIYSILILKPYFKVLLGLVLYHLLLSFIVLKEYFIIGLIFIPLLIILISIILSILLYTINTICKKDILYLLKNSKYIE